MTRLRALLASLRLANAPSVASNVWLGYMLGWAYWGGSADPFADLLKLITIGLCLYFAGNLANDWFDRKWDQEHRPERALPAGHFSPFAYIVGASFLALNGILAAATISYPVFYAAIAILLLIAIYTALHKRTRWAVIPMGLCRAGLYILGFGWNDSIPYQGLPTEVEVDGKSVSISHTLQLDWKEHMWAAAFISTHALGLLIYIAGLTLAARYEHAEHPPHGMVVLSRAMLFLPLVAMSAWWMPYYPLYSALALLPFAIWLSLCLTRFRRPVPRLVSALLAGIPLIDFITALPLATSLLLPDQSLTEVPILLTTLIIPPAAFLLSLLLQRLTPAT
ncbi:MAG: UbiA family prenyltransferase [Verrucomicrobiota bacterium]